MKTHIGINQEEVSRLSLDLGNIVIDAVSKAYSRGYEEGINRGHKEATFQAWLKEQKIIYPSPEDQKRFNAYYQETFE